MTEDTKQLLIIVIGGAIAFIALCTLLAHAPIPNNKFNDYVEAGYIGYDSEKEICISNP